MEGRACRWLVATLIIALSAINLTSSRAVAAAKTTAGSQLWVRRYNGPSNGTEALFLGGVQSVAVSPDGATVFVTGTSEGTTTSGRVDYATVTYKAATGAQLWVERYDGPAHGADAATSVAVSPDGATVFVTGTSESGATGADYATVAYNAATGAQLWVGRYNGPANQNEGALSIAVDPRGGTVFVTGTSEGSAALTNDYATVAYDAATGAQIWAERYNGPANKNDNASFMAVSPDGAAVFMTGSSTGTTSGFDYATVAYNAATGAQLWVERYNGLVSRGDEARSVAVSPDGAAVFVTGYSDGDKSGPDYATVVYDASTGTQRWVKRYDSGGPRLDFAQSVAVSSNGATVFVSGSSATVAYKAVTGAQLWRSRSSPFGGGAGSTPPPTVAVSPNGAKVFVTGTSSGAPSDYVTVAYNAVTGAPQWTRRYNGPLKRSDGARSVAVSLNGRTVFVNGISEGTGTGPDYATIAYRS